jgi:uncharacterized protein YqhQ
MKICPHCNSEIPESQRRCPTCSAQYWESDGTTRDVDLEKEEEDQGCLSIIAVHFLLALAVFVFLLLIGFVINLFVHFEENQIKVIWIGAALLLAMALSGFVTKLRKKKEKSKRDHK